MPEGSKEVSASLATIFAGIGEFFGFFDMSFFVAGASILGAAGYWAYFISHEDLNGLNSALGIGGLIIGSYVLGLVAFAMGRPIRRSLVTPVLNWSRSLKGRSCPTFGDLLENHGITEMPMFSGYRERDGKRALMYFMWAEVRKAPELVGAHRFLNRFWVMAAVFDGIALSLWVWAYVLIRVYNVFGENGYLWAICACIVASIFCFGRAESYDRNGLEEFVGSFKNYLLSGQIRTVVTATGPTSDSEHSFVGAE
jgi:hypothetical protein